MPTGWQAEHIEPVGYSDHDGRPGFKVSIKQAGGRWLLYLGHFFDSGWSILDVTDPAAPEVINFLPGPANTATLQVGLCDDIMITALEKHMRGNLTAGPGRDRSKMCVTTREQLDAGLDQFDRRRANAEPVFHVHASRSRQPDADKPTTRFRFADWTVPGFSAQMTRSPSRRRRRCGDHDQAA